jgi:hypothetical protein
MARMTAFTEAERLSLDDVLAEFRAEFPSAVITKGDVSQAKLGPESHNNGLCPFMAECYESLGLVHQHCSWNLDDPPTWRFCGGYRRRNGGVK